MLLGFGCKNFFCFKEGVEVSLRLKKNCPTSISNGKLYTDVLCVKGANGSGKTSILKIITFISVFCSDSFNTKPEDPIPLQTFFNNAEQSEFYLEFSISGVEYRYEASLTLDQVVKETIYRKKKRFIPILKRESNEITLRIDEIKDIDIIKLRSNASIISTAHQYLIESFSSIYNSINAISSNVTMFGHQNLKHGLSTVSHFYHEEKTVFNFAKKILKKCDLGINNIKIKKKQDPEEGNIYFPVFIHKNSNMEKLLLFENQSSGTKALYNQLWLYSLILATGGVLILDEFDINLHPHILPVLLDCFINKKTNPNNAQLIFTTHNTDILDVLGKQKTIFVNKEDNESYSYKLDELPGNLVRNDRPISPIYNSGKIGGVPKL